jgi:dipeptidyl aminopeptidase/acylaminoacyl peptidase
VNRFFIILSLVVLSFNGQASNLIHNDEISNQKNCFDWHFSDYDVWRDFIKNKKRNKITSEEKLKQSMSVFDTMFSKEKFDLYKSELSCRFFTYKVNGKTVKGYVIKPKVNTKKLPVLIYNRGGNGNYGGIVFGSMMRNLFPIANEGFVIIGSQYRGTFMNDPANHDEFGGKDVNDVMALLKYIPNIEGADSQRVGMFGASRGGMQTFLALKQTKSIKAVAIIAGVSDQFMGLKNRPEMEKMFKHRIPDYTVNKVSALEKRSVLFWLNELPKNVPILLLHGTNDKRVSVDQSTNLADALAKNKIPHKLVVYPNDDHGLTLNKEESVIELVHWFKKYL